MAPLIHHQQTVVPAAPVCRRLRTLAECRYLTFDGVRRRLLFTGNARVESGSNGGHKNLLGEAFRSRAVRKQAEISCTEFNLERRITNVRNKYSYLLHGQESRGRSWRKLQLRRQQQHTFRSLTLQSWRPWSTPLNHRQIAVVGEEFAVSKDGMEMFGVLDLETSFEGCRFAIGIRNANNKRFRLACTVGLRVFVCHNLAFRGDYSPVLAKHSKHFSLEDALSIGVDRMQRNFEPMRAAGGKLASRTAVCRGGKADDLPGIHRR